MIQTFLDYFHTIELPSTDGATRPRYMLLIPPFLLPDLATIALMGEDVRVISLLPLREQEFEEFSRGTRVTDFVNSLPDSLETWLFDCSLEARSTLAK